MQIKSSFSSLFLDCACWRSSIALTGYGLLRERRPQGRSMNSVRGRLTAYRALVKPTLKWLVIVNALLAAVGILTGASNDLVARIHGTSFAVILTTASLVVIGQARAKTGAWYLWSCGTVCSLVSGAVVVALIWGFEPNDALGRPYGSIAVASAIATYCALIQLIAERKILRRICWGSALIYGLYGWFLIWFSIDLIPGRVLGLLAVVQCACTLLAVIDFLGSRRALRQKEAPIHAVSFCPFCGSDNLVAESQHVVCADCDLRFKAAVE